MLSALLLLCCGWLGCKEKEEDKGLPDLSGGGYAYQNHWVFTYQVVDSIDSNSKAYLKPWTKGIGEVYFKIRSLNAEHSLYEKTNTFLDLNSGGAYHDYKDTVWADINGYLYMKIYKQTGWDAERPDSIGTFIGKYDKNTHRVVGSVLYKAYWYCPYCPMGSYRQRYAMVNAEAFMY